MLLPIRFIRSAFLPFASLLLAPAIAGAQATWYVDDDGPGDPFPGGSVFGNPAFSDPLEDGSAAHPFDEIYKAVNVAAESDEVLVLPSNFNGFYVQTSTLDLLGKAITIRSTGGAGVTALDGSGLAGASGVLLNGNSTIEGFTFQNFDRGSSSGNDGGALRVTALTPTIRDCVFLSNHAYVGGALSLVSSNALVEDCTFLSNSAVHQGGGVYLSSGLATFRRCHFEANLANYGAGFMIRSVSAFGSLTTIEDSVFFENSALHPVAGYGGALAKFDVGDVLIRRTRFIRNTAPMEGGAVLIDGRGTIRSCTFNANECDMDNGGGVLARGSAVVAIESSTFTGNLGGAVVEAPTITFATLVNCIVWGNSSFELSAQIGVTYSDVLGGYSGTGNVDVDPIFENALGVDGLAGTLDDVLSLFHASPCVDAGNANAAAFEYPTDLNNRARVVDHVTTPDTGAALLGHSIDLGAYEIQHVCKPVATLARRPLKTL